MTSKNNMARQEGFQSQGPELGDELGGEYGVKC
jgi:hypothetical protein